jgi:hypothetical protein
MKTTTNTTTEQALLMYKETVSPQKNQLQAILSQIPEQQELKEGRAVRSPYTWLAVTQVVAFCFIVIAILPTTFLTTTPSEYSYQEDPFYLVDEQIDMFESDINAEDYEKGVMSTIL